MPDDTSLSWNRFNSDFKIPESDDAARIALEVKASVDTWIQNSLVRLGEDMNKRAELSAAQLRSHIAEAKGALASIEKQIADVHDAVNALSPADPELAKKIKDLKDQTQATRNSMAQAAQEWEEYGRKTVATVESIAKTVATFA